MPGKDSALAESFISNRDFDSLRDLVHSVIKKARANKELSDTLGEESEDTLVMLESLYFEVDAYLALIYGSTEQYEEDEDFPDINTTSYPSTEEYEEISEEFDL